MPCRLSFRLSELGPPSPPRKCCFFIIGTKGGDTLDCGGGAPNSDEGTDTPVQNIYKYIKIALRVRLKDLKRGKTGSDCHYKVIERRVGGLGGIQVHQKRNGPTFTYTVYVSLSKKKQDWSKKMSTWIFCLPAPYECPGSRI